VIVPATIYVERDGEEIELSVQGEYTPAVRASRGGHPDTWTPAEGDELEIVAVLHADKPWTGELTNEEIARAEDSVREMVASDFGDDDGPDYDDRGDDDHYDLEAACARFDHWGDE
jgi:hypothetical protein